MAAAPADDGQESIREWIRTTNLRLRRPTLYPIELRGRIVFFDRCSAGRHYKCQYLALHTLSSLNSTDGQSTPQETRTVVKVHYTSQHWLACIVSRTNGANETQV